MIKKLLLFAMCCTLALPGRATHLMGGEMTVEHLSGNDFIIHLTAYRDTIGVPFALTATFDVYDIGNNLVLTSTVPQDPNSGNLMPAAPYGVEVYFFTDTVTVPALGSYRVEWLNCCRNGAITNLNTPLAENMFLYTTFTHTSNPDNSTPVFLAPPVTFVPINLPWQYNSLPLDPDGDSLAWTLDTPYTSSGVYAAGWVTPSAAANGAFTLDPITGQIDWTPNMYGNYVASIRVEEYRGGTKIGEIRRDYQMIVIDDTTKKTAPRITNFGGMFPLDANGHYYKDLVENTPITITMLAEDQEGNQVEFLSYGEPYLHPTNPATFSTIPFNGTDMLGMFMWTPDNTQTRSNPYIVVFRTRDQLFSFDETVLFYVHTALGIQDNDQIAGAPVYPNPAVNLVFVPLKLERAADVAVSLYDTRGSVVARHTWSGLPAGEHLKQLELDVPPGMYFISLDTGTGNPVTKKLMVK